MLQLADDAGGRFALDGVVLKVAGALDHEHSDRHTVVLRARVGEQSTTERFVIDVTDVNEAPIIRSIRTTDVREGAARGTEVASIYADDPKETPSSTRCCLDVVGSGWRTVPRAR